MSDEKVIRVVLDVNIFVRFELGLAARRLETPSHKLIGALQAGKLGDTPVQVVLSLAMIDTFRRVLLRRGADAEATANAAEGLLNLVKRGPEALDPLLLLDGSDAPFALRDREDAGVLAAAFAARAQVLVTDNLADFETKAVEKRLTLLTRHPDGSPRQLFTLVHRGPAGHRLVIAHPLDVLRACARQTLASWLAKFPA